MEATIPTKSSLLSRLLRDRPMDDLRTLRQQILAELMEAQASSRRLRGELQELDRVIEARGGSAVPAPPTAADPNPLPLRKAILRLLDERPEAWTREDLLNELGRRGWAPGGRNPRNTLISRLSEMAREDLIEKEGRSYRARREAAQQSLP
jgi:hypothetical protein